MEEKIWLDYVVAVGTISTPILVLIIGAIVWKYQKSIERRTKLEEQLRDDRIETYNQILEPFIILLMSDAAWASDPKNRNKDKFNVATSKMLALEYRKTSFRLSLIGSDAVVKSFNNLMQFSFHMSTSRNASASQSATRESDTRKMVSLLGNLLLEIRRSMGNEATEIDNIGMIEWFITDAREYRETDP